MAIFTKLMQRPMDRKTFLKTVLLGVAVIGGLSGFVRLFGTNKPRTSQAGYGASVYGGAPKQGS
jgi:hypothetical protein